MNKKLDQEIRRVANKYYEDVEVLTLSQFEEVLKQAISSGDFIRYVNVDTDSQAVAYVPFQEKQRLEGELKSIRKALWFLVGVHDEGRGDCLGDALKEARTFLDIPVEKPKMTVCPVCCQSVVNSGLCEEGEVCPGCAAPEQTGGL